MTYYRTGRQQPQQPSRYGRGQGGSNRNSRGGQLKLMLIIGLGYAAFTLFKFYANTQVNPVTGEKQYISITASDEIAIGLQATPQMVQQHGGIHPDQRRQTFIKEIGRRLLGAPSIRGTEYRYDFHVLADPSVVNAFALPGGQVFITDALLSRLTSEDMVAGVVGHEIGHVIHRHGAERMAKMDLTQGLTGAAVLASGNYDTAQAAQMIGNLVNMSYGREQELESDEIGVLLMIESGYDPEALISVMDVLEEASGGSKVPEFQSTHPSPENRREKIMEAINKYQK